MLAFWSTGVTFEMLTLALQAQREPMIRAAALAIACLTAAMLLASPAQAGGPQGAPGNNGTVKIHDGSGEPSPEVRNQPHVCTFHLHFFFGDAEQTGDWWIESWPPTGDRTVAMGPETYTTDANGEDRAPATGAYELPDGHYKLFWEGATNPGEQTNIKHKVFWVDCPPAGGTSGGGNGGNGNGGGNGNVGGNAGGGSGEGTLGGSSGPGVGTLPDTSTEPARPGTLFAVLLIVGAMGGLTVMRGRGTADR
jgi:hypothetical protein